MNLRFSLERLVTAWLALMAVATCTGTVLALRDGRFTAAVAWPSLAAGAAVALAVVWSMRRQTSLPRPGVGDIILGVVLLLASLRAFLWLVTIRGAAVMVLSPFNLGDMALHITFIQHLVRGAPFWPENPLLSGAPLHYPLGTDIWNAVLVLAGHPFLEGFILTGVLGSVALTYALWRWGRAFGTAAFLLGGGLAGFAIFAHGQFHDHLEAVQWKNLFLTMWVTQRGLLYALPAGLLLLSWWRDTLTGAGAGGRAAPLWIQVLLYAAMPLFNLHAFVFLSVVLASVFLAGRGGRAERGSLVVVVAAFLPATGLVWLVTGGFAAKSLIRWYPGWMQEDGGWWFWLLNFGLWIPLGVWLLLRIVWWRDEEGPVFDKEGHDAAGLLTLPDEEPSGGRAAAARSMRAAWAFCFPAMAVFALCCLISFATWPWDNTKLMLWSLLVLAPFMWSLLLAALPWWARGLLCFGLFFSGALALAAGLDQRHGYQLADRAEWAQVAHAVGRLPAASRVAVVPIYDHPVLLCGQAVSMGYDGHLWSHGHDYGAVQRDLGILMAGEPGWEDAARRLGVRYLFWGRRESAKYPQSFQPWKRGATVLDRSPAGTLFDLVPVLGPVPTANP